MSPERFEPADPHLRPLGHWDRLWWLQCGLYTVRNITNHIHIYSIYLKYKFHHMIHKKIVHCSLRDATHRLSLGFLHFQKVVQFGGTHHWEKYGPRLWRFSQKSQMPNRIHVQNPDTDFHANRIINVASMGTNSFTPRSKATACTTPTLTKLTISH